MSSHHIVREKQEPALLVLSLNHFTDEELGQLLEWSPTLIATPLTAEQLTVYDIKVDYVMADSDTVIPQSDVQRIVYDGHSFLQTALGFLTANGYPAVNIVADEFLLSDYEAYAGKIDLVVFYAEQKIYPVTSGFSKWKPAGEVINVISPCNTLQADGLAALPGNQYQTTRDGFFKLQFNEPYLFIAEKYA